MPKNTYSLLLFLPVFYNMQCNIMIELDQKIASKSKKMCIIL